MSDAPAADYAVSIIEALADCPALMGISDISRETGINKNAVSRVLGSLLNKGWVYQDGLKYQLTLKPFKIASNALGRITLCNASQPILTKLWEKTGDSCYIGILKFDSVLYLGHIDSSHDIKITGRVGGTYPLECSAPGKVLLAYSDEAYRCAFFANLRWSEDKVAEFEEKLKLIRERGWATDVEEYGPGIICFAAPIFDISGNVVGTIGVSTSTAYCNEESIIRNQGAEVIAAAREISEILGATV